MNQDKPKILILYYSRSGSVRAMAEHIATGVESAAGEAILRTVPPVGTGFKELQPQTPNDGAPYVQKSDLADADGLIIGSPTRFGNMAAPLKYFLDQTSPEWTSGTLIDKPVSFFTSTASMHGGQETTLLTMMLPFMHHGAVIVGVPYSETALFTTTGGGTPYGASHFAGQNDLEISADEKQICISQGKRMAEVAKKLRDN